MNNQNLPALKTDFAMPSISELKDLTNFCHMLAQAPFYQKLGVGGVMAIFLTAKELKLPFMTCLNGALYTFDGKVTMSAQLMNVMIVNAGHRADVLRLDDSACHIRFFRSDRKKGEGDYFEYIYSIEMAQKAGLANKDVWKKNPRDMLYSRTLSGGARKFMPDVLMNCYVFGEIESETFSDAHLTNVMPASIVSIPDSPKQEPPKIEHVKAEGWEEFVKKHNLHLSESFKSIFMLENCKKSNKSEVEMINAFIANENKFEERFKVWFEINCPELVNIEIEEKKRILTTT